ncbi:MAG: hypothetical protein FWE07_03705 [Turicibacter sp.]|nr:hypothetical protein [Turicibacter sp.]
MKKLLTLTAALGILAIGFYFYFINVGRIRPNENETFVISSEIPPAFNGVRIVHISDLLIRNEASLALLENVVAAINELDPDLVAFTGNLFLPEGLMFEEQVIELLSGIEANLSQLAVFGYHDVISASHQERTNDVLAAAGFLVLNNESIEIFNQAPQGIQVMGVAPTLTRDSLFAFLDGHVREDRFNLLLMSVPTFSAVSVEQPVHLQLSGHCLGERDTADLRQPCAQFYNGIYQFADALTVNVSAGAARFTTTFGMTQRPSIDSFLLIRE